MGEAAEMLGRPLALVRRLTGGEHAQTVLCSDGVTDLVVRSFPVGDRAVAHEMDVLGRLEALGEQVPRLVAATIGDDGSRPVIVTTRVAGTHLSLDVDPHEAARGLARGLALVHRLDGTGLRPAGVHPPTGLGPAAQRARDRWDELDRREPVLTHDDYWSGNTLWQGGSLSGIVDWSGARQAPRGVDLAWCRLDLVLLGCPAAARTLLHEYERASGRQIADIIGWDVQAAAHAEDVVESWAANYAGVGRRHLTGRALRERLDRWSHDL
ncbi:MAG TPA: aminoglycoside phosphotransferase family protein [Actinomycetales bacterium]